MMTRGCYVRVVPNDILVVEIGLTVGLGVTDAVKVNVFGRCEWCSSLDPEMVGRVLEVHNSNMVTIQFHKVAVLEDASLRDREAERIEGRGW